MVAVTTIQTSNARIAATLPTTTTPQVALFIGATSGIGKSSLLQYAKHTASNNPRIYFVGRSQSAADEILQQLRAIKPDGKAEYVFIKADVSLLAEVDAVCKQIKEKESAINLLLLSQGTLDQNTRTYHFCPYLYICGRTESMAETSEKLTLFLSLSYYSRMRFIANLLPLLQAATPSISRVISVMAGTKEGPINPSDIAGKKVSMLKARGHLCSMTTLTMEAFAKSSPGVSFIHSYPGFVDTGLGRTMTGFTGGAMKVAFVFALPFLRKYYIPFEECGDRYTFLATSSRYAAGEEGVKVDGNETAVGSNGKIGSGVYTVDEKNESGDASVQAILEALRRNGVKDKVWQHVQDEFVRITGAQAMMG